MRIAILSDIHGNLPALTAALADARAQKVDEIIFAGDYIGDFPYPNEVVGLLRDTAHAHIIRGNKEDYLAGLQAQDPAEWTDGQYQGLYWNYRELTEENRRFLISLPRSVSLTFEGVRLLVTHKAADWLGEIRLNLSSLQIAKALSEGLSGEGVKGHVHQVVSSHEELGRLMEGLAYDGVIFGHSHIQWQEVVRGKRLINGGSCGLPLDGQPGAPYTILEIGREGMAVEERRVPYDTPALIRALRDSSLYRQAPVWSEIIVREVEDARNYIIGFFGFAEKYAHRIGDSRRPFSAETWQAAYQCWVGKPDSR